MANCKKYTRAAIGHLFAHYERQRDEKGEYVKFGNRKIDPERTHLNYNLAAEDQPMGQYEYLQKRLGEVFCQNRKDVNVMCSWVVTAPEDLPREELESFFRHSYDFLSDRYGKDNVISAYVHMDESSPHMHFSFVPVCPDKKRGLKVSAKKVISKTELERFHPLLQAYLEDKLGHEVGVLNGATLEGNKSAQQLKRISELEEKLSSLEVKTKDAQEKLDNIINTGKSVSQEIKALKEKKETYKKGVSWIENLTENTTPVLGKVMLKQSDFEELTRTYKDCLYALTDLEVERKLYDEKNTQLNSALKWKNKYYNFRSEHADDISKIDTLEKKLDLQLKNNRKLVKKNAELEKLQNKILDFISDRSPELWKMLIDLIAPKKERTRDRNMSL